MDQRHTLDVHVSALDDVLRRAYELAAFDGRERPYLKSRRGAMRQSQWALDMRKPLSLSHVLQPVARTMAMEFVTQAGITQVAGYGYGSFALLGGIISHGDGLVGALVRETRKSYGFGELVEGHLRRDVPVVVVDDLLGTGRSTLRAAAALRAEGFTVTGAYTVFRFAWKRGRKALRAEGLGHRCLATLRHDTEDSLADSLEAT